ncbi:hypothetical protein ACFC2A_05550 [Enterobacter hormaechei]
MDFIKHDETPLFLLIAHLTAASKIEAPEVLTDVALLCVVKKPSSKGGGKIKNK